MLPNEVSEAIEAELGEPVLRHQSVSGGCIANASRIETRSASYFLKWSRDEVAQTFPAEAAGLRALREAQSDLIVPEPIAASNGGQEQPGFLLIPWIESGQKRPDFWERFGRGLAALHRHAHDQYGFEIDNYIGRLPQSNEWAESWPLFFLTQRLNPQVHMARERGLWKSRWNANLERLSKTLDQILPQDPEGSVLHGDLWGGNFLAAHDGRAALVDPAAYYGHREADIAMTRLFGGFQQPFYDAYQEAWPFEPGHDERFEVYNLYHLINHLNHFGAGYAGSVERILARH